MTYIFEKQKQGKYSLNNKNPAVMMVLNEYASQTHMRQKLSNEQRPLIRPEKGLVQKLKSFKK